MQQKRFHMRIREVGVGAVPGTGSTCRQFIVAKGIGRKVRHGGEEARRLPALSLGQCHQVERRGSRAQCIVQRDVSQQFLTLVVATIGLTVAPHDGGIIVGVVHAVIGIGAETTQFQVLSQRERRIQMHVEVAVVLVLLHRQQ